MGQRFGNLVVIEFAGTGDERKAAKWKCRCDCGNVVPVYCTSLRRGFSKTCGDRRNHIRRPRNLLAYGESSFNVYFKLLKESAVRRGMKFELTKEQVKDINSKNCFYCGSP